MFTPPSDSSSSGYGANVEAEKAQRPITSWKSTIPAGNDGVVRGGNFRELFGEVLFQHLRFSGPAHRKVCLNLRPIRDQTSEASPVGEVDLNLGAICCGTEDVERLDRFPAER
jgi:hypothetical protein